jgi:hypothetical protein
VRTYTAHIKPRRPPVLMRDAWSWGGFIFGPLWLLSMRALIPALLEIVALALLFTLVPPPFWRPSLLGLALINGLLGRDMAGWALDRRGYAIEHIVLAPDQDAALLRLFTARPDLVDYPR